jgi:hypothetical protein
MPSVVTARRERPRRRFAPRLPRWAAAAWGAAVVVLTLAGCATGRVDEARIAETREATRGAILADVQATNVVKKFFEPTPTALPSVTPLPTLAALTLATQIGSDNRPTNEVESVRQGSTVYAVAEIHELQPGQEVIGVWTTADGAEVGRSSVPVDRGLSAAWVPLQWTANVGPGTYAVKIYVNERLLNSLVFRVN